MVMSCAITSHGRQDGDATFNATGKVLYRTMEKYKSGDKDDPRDNFKWGCRGSDVIGNVSGLSDTLVKQMIKMRAPAPYLQKNSARGNAEPMPIIVITLPHELDSLIKTHSYEVFVIDRQEEILGWFEVM